MKKSQFSDEQIVRILQEAVNGQKSQAQVCRDVREPEVGNR